MLKLVQVEVYKARSEKYRVSRTLGVVNRRRLLSKLQNGFLRQSKQTDDSAYTTTFESTISRRDTEPIVTTISLVITMQTNLKTTFYFTNPKRKMYVKDCQVEVV